MAEQLSESLLNPLTKLACAILKLVNERYEHRPKQLPSIAEMEELLEAHGFDKFRHGTEAPRCPKCGKGISLVLQAFTDGYALRCGVNCGFKIIINNFEFPMADLAQFFPAQNNWIPISKQPDIGQWVHVIINEVVQKMPCALDLHGWGGEHGKTWRWLDETAPHAPFETVSHWQALPEWP